MTASREGARIFTVPPGVPFLRALAEAVLAGGFPEPGRPSPGPVALSDWRVLVPTRRAARAFAETFLDAAPRGALLLPRIAPLGDVDEDELMLAGDPEPGIAEVAPAISGLTRRLLLTRFILRWGEARHEGIRAPAQAVHLARELGRLIDAVETEQADWSALEGLVDREFAAHWGNVIEFLDLLRRDLPEELERRGEMNPMARRNLLMAANAADLAARGSSAPIVAAGSTGSIPATADLLRTIAALPTGAVVLPGLDRHMDEASWDAVAPNHPQYGMKQLLQRVGVTREEVVLLPGIDEDPRRLARNRLAGEVVRPAATTDEWVHALGDGGVRGLGAALDGVRVIAAPAQREEALAIALIMRETLETPGRTVALVTPDRGLARRVTTELDRWDIAVDDTAGVPLHGTAQGTLAGLMVAAAASGFAPVELLALLKHPLATFGRERGEVLRLVRMLELGVLRGTISPRGFKPLAAALAGARSRALDEHHRTHRAVRAMSVADWDALAGFVDHLSAVLEPFGNALAHAATPDVMLTAHVGALEAASLAPGEDAPRVWQGDGGEALAELFAALIEAGALMPDLARHDYGPFVSGLMADRTVRPRGRTHARVRIWGLLEARLLQADVMILGGLNEGVWPASTGNDPFLNRPMRADFGLEPPERRIGLSAHDFVQGLNAPDVVLTWSQKIDGAPVGPSRWILRLEMAMKAAGRAPQRAADRLPVDWALGLDHSVASFTVSRPHPRPPVALRPRRMSVTRVEEWTRDPYATFARSVLKLDTVDPLATDPGAADRGTLIHDILHAYARQSFPTPPDDSLATLIATGRAHFDAYLDFPDVAAFWWNRFVRIAEWLVEEDAFATADVSQRLTEVDGTLEIPGPAGPFVLSARADRIDILAGRAVIYDYKTGAAPSEKQMASGLKPQMPLEAAMVRRGGFAGLGPTPVGDLVHMRLTGGPVAGDRRALARNAADDLGERAHAGLVRWLARFDDPRTPYPPREIPEREAWPGDYDHLSRYAEWSRTGAAEEGA